MLVNLPWGLYTYGRRISQHRFDLLLVLHFMEGFQMLTESAYQFPTSGVCTPSDYIPSAVRHRHLWLHLVNFYHMPRQIYHEGRTPRTLLLGPHLWRLLSGRRKVGKVISRGANHASVFSRNSLSRSTSSLRFHFLIRVGRGVLTCRDVEVQRSVWVGSSYNGPL